ncbi:MAG: metallophosphoesterase, partial [Candidatus Eremiobacterota bacterium]
MTRRSLFRAALGLGAAGLARLALEPWFTEVRHVEVRLADLPEVLEGFTITQLSDLHRGPWVPEVLLRRGVELANTLRSDLVVLTGDFLSVSRAYAGSLVDVVAGLSAPEGVFAVLGNHDYWCRGQGRLQEGFRHKGVELLVNQAARMSTRGVDWWLVGLDDAWAGRPDLGRALAGVPRDAFRLLLAHEPDFADTAARQGIPLQLSGHSHGGQVRLPGLGPPILPPWGRKYPIGLQRVSPTTQVYTNVGLG